MVKLPKRKILLASCDVWGVDPESVVSKSRKGYYVYARQMYCFFANKEGYSVREIGKYINRDRTTIIYSIDRHNDDLEKNNLVIKRSKQCAILLTKSGQNNIVRMRMFSIWKAEQWVSDWLKTNKISVSPMHQELIVKIMNAYNEECRKNEL